MADQPNTIWGCPALLQLPSGRRASLPMTLDGDQACIDLDAALKLVQDDYLTMPGRPRVVSAETRVDGLRHELERLRHPGRRPRTEEGREIVAQLAEAIDAILARDSAAAADDGPWWRT